MLAKLKSQCAPTRVQGVIADKAVLLTKGKVLAQIKRCRQSTLRRGRTKRDAVSPWYESSAVTDLGGCERTTSLWHTPLVNALICSRGGSEDPVEEAPAAGQSVIARNSSIVVTPASASRAAVA